MYCPKCGKQNKDNARFCAYCGAELITEESNEIHPEKQAPKKKKSVGTVFILGFAVVIFIILALVYLRKGDLTGKYININDKNEIMELRRDGTFLDKQHGMNIPGKYKVKDGRIVFTVDIFGVTQSSECKLVKNGFDCEDKSQYRKINKPMGKIFMPKKESEENIRLDRTIKGSLSGLRSSAELYSMSNNGSYSGFCASSDIARAKTEISNSKKSMVCKDSETEWIACSPIYNTTDKVWCVDSTGQSKAESNIACDSFNDTIKDSRGNNIMVCP